MQSAELSYARRPHRRLDGQPPGRRVTPCRPPLLCPSPCRHCSLPLVSRRCWQLLRTPQLLHTLDVIISGSNDEQAMPRLRSLAQFLLKHGAGRVRRLQLYLGCCGEAEHSAAECQVLAACAATACSGLQELEIECQAAVTLSSWLLPLASSLRSLSTGVGTSAVVAGPLRFLTSLQDLELAPLSDFVLLEADACLPTSLTRLALGNGNAVERMPPQVPPRGAPVSHRPLHLLLC